MIHLLKDQGINSNLEEHLPTSLKKSCEEESTVVISFDMKDLGASSKILGISIQRDRKQSRLCLSQESYLKKILDNFGISNSKLVLTPTNPQYKSSMTQSASIEVERFYINTISYASILRSLM